MPCRRVSRLLAAAVGAACLGAGLVAQTPPRSSFVMVDASVVDRDGQTVSGLREQDFQLRDDGRPVALKTFKAVSATGIEDRSGGRTVMLVLDDTGVPTPKTVNVQYIARAFLARATPADAVSVVRFNDRMYELTRDHDQALATIAEFRAGIFPFQGRATYQDALETVARLSRFVEGDDGRKVIVCIGAPAVFDVGEPGDGAYSMIWRQWVDAMRSAARANVSVFLIDPNGSAGGFHVQQAGLITHTGGAAFMNSNAFDRAVDRVWREAGHYYMLGYEPTSKARELHKIELTVSRKGLQVHARRLRGD
jgi:VWFA-related protein